MSKIKDFLMDSKKRYLVMVIAFVPIIVAMIFFGFRAYKDIKSILILAGDGETVEVKDTHKIESMNYVLRDNATAYQEEIFKQLKDAIEGTNQDPENPVTEEDKIALVAMNHIADYYTFSNKVAQYDVGGLYYVNADARENIFVQSRDTIYKYINEYIDKYGAENLLEVDNVTATVKKDSKQYPITTIEYTYVDHYTVNETATTTDYDAWIVDVNWSYKPSEVFSTSKWPTSTQLKIIYDAALGRYEIVAAGSMVNVEQEQEQAQEDAQEEVVENEAN